MDITIKEGLEQFSLITKGLFRREHIYQVTPMKESCLTYIFEELPTLPESIRFYSDYLHFQGNLQNLYHKI